LHRLCDAKPEREDNRRCGKDAYRCPNDLLACAIGKKDWHNSHKIIRNLLDGVIDAADEVDIEVRCIQKVSESEEDLPRLQSTTDNGDLLAAIGTSSQVAAGTAWLWARPDAFERLDVLFIDEAAQMSLANVLAVSQSASSVVLFRRSAAT
jgi:hypothetical protein